MFARGCGAGGRILRHHGSCTARRVSSLHAPHALARRRFTSSAPRPQDGALSPATHPLAGVTSELDHIAPRFEVDPSQIEILDSPIVFYETLKVRPRLQADSSAISRTPMLRPFSRLKFEVQDDAFSCRPCTLERRNTSWWPP